MFEYELDEKWQRLSNEAKSIINWVENPYTNKRNDVWIKVGSHFKRYCGDDGTVDILVTEELFSEIENFVSQDKELEYKVEKEMTFKIKDSSKLRLH